MQTSRVQQSFQRWRRLCLRVVDRARWHVQGLLLWLLQRPYLRYVPFPYPSIKTIDQWKLQAEQMVSGRVLSRKHLERAKNKQAFTAKSLQELTWFRNRVGLQVAFMEDVLLSGMLAARSNRGTSQLLKKAALEEAQKEAAQITAEGKKDEFLRQLIGPRGGLPTLKADLLRLAALLEVTLDPKATVDEIKELCGPVVKKRMEASKQKTKSGRAAPQASQALASAQEARPATSSRSQDSMTHSPTAAPTGISMQEVHELLQQQDQRFQGMMSQVMQHVVNIRDNPLPQRHRIGTPTSAEPAQETTGNPLHPGYTEEELMQMQIDHQQDMREERFEMQHGPVLFLSDLADYDSDQFWMVKMGMQALLRTWTTPTRSIKPWNPVLVNWSRKPGSNMNVIKSWFLSPRKMCKTSSRQNGPISWIKPWMRPLSPPSGFPRSRSCRRSLLHPSEWLMRQNHVDIKLVQPCLLKQAGTSPEQLIAAHKPFFLVLAFPCGPWSPLMRLNPAHDLAEKQEVGLELIRFAIKLSEIQLEGKRHFLMENPTPSSCWKLPEMIKFLEEHFVHLARFDQCRFDLKSATGNFHRKSTTIATSSQEMKDALDGVKCLRDHSHQPVLGGPAITQRAGHYPQKLAAAMVNGMENEFHKQFSRKSKHEALAVEGDGVDDDGAETPGPMGYESSDSEEVENWRAEPGKEDVHLRADPSMKDDHSPSFSSKIPAAIKMAVKRLHETTGHRSNRRLARALVLSGAPQQVIEAAKKHKCSVCDERKSPKPRRPASLPTPKDVSDQVHIDIFEVHDAREEKSYVVHMVDYASRLQMAKLLPDKSTESVVSFLKEHWFPVMGPPRVLVADQGKEFVSWRFEEACSEHSILLWHCAIQAPWQNGICERSGGILKVLIGAIVRSKSVLGKQEMQWAVQEAVTAYNQDINEYGVSPLQAAFGRQPRMQGDILGGFGNTLAEHGLIDNKPSLARQLALREVAKVAMARLHFSQSLRKALLAQSKTTTQTHDLQPGQVVYYYRFTKYNNKTEPARRKLSLRRWHGPALLIAFDGHANCFVSHRGQVAKVALEHLRPASTMEQVAHGVWRDSIEDIVEESIRSITEQGAQVEPSQPQAVEAPQNVPDRAISTTSHTEPTDLPEVQPQELIQAAADAQAGDGSVPDESRRTSLLTAMPGTPVASLLRRPSAISARMEQAIGRAQDLARSSAADEVPVPPDDGWQGQKRQAEVPLDELQEQTRAEEEPTPFPAPPPVDGFEVFEMTHQEMTMCSDPSASHPLRLLCQQVAKDRKNPLETFVEDHGTWKGYWPLPSRSEWQAVLSIGGMWPKGEHEALAATARREYKWKEIPMNDRPQFVEAAKTGWQVWVDNDAVQILDDKEAAATWKRLEATGKKHLVLTPRFVFTDKHDGLRTENVKLPLKANARLVVPGYKDISAYDVRKDAPTGGRISQHLLLLFTASHSWTLASADVKSAFLKGEEFQPGERELYITNIRVLSSDEPTLPLGRQGLARLRKGIFGLSDSPRRWYLRLHKSLVRLGWVRSEIDAAFWYLWGPDRQLRGMVLSHVDDLLIGGDEVAMKSIKKLGEELGFGSLEFGKFTYCGKTFEQHPDKSISISMQSYHDNMKLVKIPVDRRRNPEAALTPSEQKSLRGVLGSLQWLVAQVRIDMSYPLSVLQGESPTVSTLLKANSLVKRFKQSSEFALWFRPMKLDGCGLIGVSDASLGNTMKSGGVGMDPMVRVYSQCGYLMLIGDSDMMSGREGHFALLDGRSHRLSRVCRSTYAAELLSAEETFDVGQYCRGVLAEALGYPMNQRDVSACCDAVPLTVVVDAKDVFDKSTSDTPSYGSQKSLAFSVAWLRNLLRRPNCNIRWTATANMLADALTKDMDAEHLRKVLTCGKWCTRYSPQFVKQTGGQKRNSTTVDRVTVGKPLELDDPMFGRLLTLSESPGWHFEDDIPILVAKAAKSFRTPEPRFDSKEFNRRTSFGRFDTGNGSSEWRELERDVDYWGTRKHALIGQDCSCLITCFRRSSQANKESRSTVEESICHGWSLEHVGRCIFRSCCGAWHSHLFLAAFLGLSHYWFTQQAKRLRMHFGCSRIWFAQS